MSSPSSNLVLTETYITKPQWFTWAISLCILVVLIAACGTLLPQSAKKFVIYPAMIFMLAGFVAYEAALLCQIHWTRFQLCVAMCCILSGYLGQQYLSYQQFLVHQRKSLNPEFSGLLLALKNAPDDSPEQQELKKRIEQKYDPSMIDYLRWKYSLLNWSNTVPPTLIFIMETAITWGVAFLVMWRTILSCKNIEDQAIVTGESGVSA